MKNRLFTIFIIIALTLSSMSFGVAAEEIEEGVILDEEVVVQSGTDSAAIPEQNVDLSADDNAETEEKTDEISVNEAYMEAYGIVEAVKSVTEFLPNDNSVTRSEFVSAIVSLLKYETVTNELSFKDVNKEDDKVLYAALSTAVANGLIRDDTEFRPNDEITVDECMIICIRALGYEWTVQRFGGHLNLARRIGLINGVSRSGVSKENAYIILKNMLIAPTLDLSSVVVDGDDTDIIYDEKENLLSVRYGIYETKGIVSANNYTARGRETDEGEINRIVINGTKYEGNGEFNAFLGLNVKAYYKKDAESGKRNLIYVTAENNNVVEIKASDLSAKILSDHSIKAFATEGNKTKEYQTIRAVDVIYNGKFYYSYTPADIVPESGSVTLIDNNGDGKYEIYKIDNYYYITDAKVSLVEKTIADGQGKAKVKLDETDYFIKDLLTENELNLVDIKDGSVVAVKTSKDKLLNELYLCTTTVEGKVQKQNTSKETIVVNDVEYKLSKHFISKYTNNIMSKDSVVFYLGINDEIIFIKDAVTGYKYAWVIAVANSEGFTKLGQIMLFTQDDEMKVFDVADKFYIDGAKLDTTTLTSNIATQKMVKYMLNSKGQLNRLDTEEAGTDFVNPETSVEGDSLKNYGLATRVYRADTKSFSAKYKNTNDLTQGVSPGFRADNAVIFAIPNDATVLDEYNRYKVISLSSFSTTAYNVIPYDISVEGYAGAFVWKYNSYDLLSRIGSAGIMIVEDVVDSIDNDGNIGKRVTGWSGGKFLDFYLSNDVTVSKATGENYLTSGDIIRYSARDGSIETVVVDFDAAPNVFGRNNITAARKFEIDTTNAETYQSGKVYARFGEYIYLSGPKDASGNYSFDFKDLRLFKVLNEDSLVVYDKDARENKLRRAYYSDMNTYVEDGPENADFVVIHQKNFYSYATFIYK